MANVTSSGEVIYGEPVTNLQVNNRVEPVGVFKKKKVIFRAYQLIWYLLGVIETLLIFRFFLKMIGANSGSQFVRFIYAASAGLVRPFQLVVFPTVAGVAIFEWSTLVAAAVYAVVAYGLVYLFQLIKPVEPDEVEQVVSNP